MAAKIADCWFPVAGFLLPGTRFGFCFQVSGFRFQVTGEEPIRKAEQLILGRQHTGGMLEFCGPATGTW
jgi:hypothetical protein